MYGAQFSLVVRSVTPGDYKSSQSGRRVRENLAAKFGANTYYVLTMPRQNCRIVVGGFHHETNAHIQETTTVLNFLDKNHAFRSLFGPEINKISDVRSLPISGALRVFRGANVEIIPTAWLYADPGGRIDDSVRALIVDKLVAPSSSASDIDGIFLDLHGATSFLDNSCTTSWLLATLRKHMRVQVPIGCAFDCHANLNDAIMHEVDAAAIYRTYPHIDLNVTGARAASRLLKVIENRRIWKGFWSSRRHVPLPEQCTLKVPAFALISTIQKIAAKNNALAEVAFGFPFTHVSEGGVSVAAFGDDKGAVENTLNLSANAINHYLVGLEFRPLQISDLASTVQSLEHKVLVADAEDNPGSGCRANDTSVLMALSDCANKRVFSALHVDASFVQRAWQAGEGGSIGGAIGTGLQGVFRILKLRTGKIRLTSQMWSGESFDIGPASLIEWRGSANSLFQAIIATKPMQAADHGLLEAFGVEFSHFDVLVLKSAVHFLAGFRDFKGTIVYPTYGGMASLQVGVSRAEYSNVRSLIKQSVY
jgi:microcystin degradation protein MlrC